MFEFYAERRPDESNVRNNPYLSKQAKRVILEILMDGVVAVTPSASEPPPLPWRSAASSGSAPLPSAAVPMGPTLLSETLASQTSKASAPTPDSLAPTSSKTSAPTPASGSAVPKTPPKLSSGTRWKAAAPAPTPPLYSFWTFFWYCLIKEIEWLERYVKHVFSPKDPLPPAVSTEALMQRLANTTTSQARVRGRGNIVFMVFGDEEVVRTGGTTGTSSTAGEKTCAAVRSSLWRNHAIIFGRCIIYNQEIDLIILPTVFFALCLQLSAAVWPLYHVAQEYFGF